MLLRSLGWLICAFFAAATMASLSIAMSEANRMRGTIEGITSKKVNHLPAAGGDLSARSGVSSLHLSANTVPPVTVLTKDVEVPSRNRQKVTISNVKVERPVVVHGPEVNKHEYGDLQFNQQGEQTKVSLHHVRPNHPRLGYDDDRQYPTVRSERVVSIVQHPRASSSAALFSGGQVAGEVNTVSAAQIATMAKTFGPVARERLTRWRALMSSRENRAMPERQKLELVNDFINRTPFKSDRDHWGKEDYWATPIEFLTTNGGDCEDFAIAKYFTLRALGVPEERLQITYVKEVNLYNEAHMVLAYFPEPDAEPLILDNVNKTIQPASTRIDLIPVYSFNGAMLWLAREQTGRSQSEGSSDRLAQWTDLQMRMKNLAYPTLQEWKSRNRV